MTRDFSEDKLVQETTGNYFRDQLAWESVFAYNEEVLGVDGTLGRQSERELVLVRYLCQALEKLNPHLPPEAYESAIKQITETSVTKSLVQIKRERLRKNGFACLTMKSQRTITSSLCVSSGSRVPCTAADRISSAL